MTRILSAGMKHLRDLRLTELDVAEPFLLAGHAEGRRLLELGAGAGWQATELSRRGFEVEALEVASSNYRDDLVFPVKFYEGRELPFEDSSFDLVFSSNVLEHIPDVALTARETLRVLKKDGRAVHLLPSPAWRWWVTALHYPAMARELLRRAAGERTNTTASSGGPSSETRNRAAMLIAGLKTLLWPARHGERGNWMSEPYFFSRTWWRRCFESAGFEVVEERPVGLFYTGWSLFGARIPMGARRRLSRWLGSACNLFVLDKRGRQRYELSGSFTREWFELDEEKPQASGSQVARGREVPSSARPKEAR